MSFILNTDVKNLTLYFLQKDFSNGLFQKAGLFHKFGVYHHHPTCLISGYLLTKFEICKNPRHYQQLLFKLFRKFYIT